MRMPLLTRQYDTVEYTRVYWISTSIMVTVEYALVLGYCRVY